MKRTMCRRRWIGEGVRPGEGAGGGGAGWLQAAETKRGLWVQAFQRFNP